MVRSPELCQFDEDNLLCRPLRCAVDPSLCSEPAPRSVSDEGMTAPSDPLREVYTELARARGDNERSQILPVKSSNNRIRSRRPSPPLGK
jgi:hypothetical protein